MPRLEPARRGPPGGPSGRPACRGPLVGALLLLSVAACAAPAPPSAPMLAIVGVAVVDVEGGRVSADRTVVVREDRVVAVGPSGSVPIPPSATVIDGAGGYLLPGLWDMHVHALFDADLAERMLGLLVANGVTGIRDMGGKVEVLVDVRARVRNGELVAPRIVAPGPILDGPGAPNPDVSWVLATPREADRAVDSLVAAGVDFLKVYTMLPADVFHAIADRARAAGLPVAGHVPGSVTPVEAARAGMASMEHLRSEIEPFCTGAAPEACDAPFRAFREHGVWQTPTLVVRRNRAFLDDSTVVAGPGVDRAPEALRAEWSATRASRRERGREYFAAARDRHREERWLTGRLDAAGIPLLAGSDAGALYSVHGFSLHEELELLVAAGLSPAGALRAATVGPAAFLGARDSLGTIAEGSRADLLLLEADPLEDIRNTRRIRAVVLRGRYLGRPALDSLLAAGPAL